MLSLKIKGWLKRYVPARMRQKSVVFMGVCTLMVVFILTVLAQSEQEPLQGIPGAVTSVDKLHQEPGIVVGEPSERKGSSQHEHVNIQPKPAGESQQQQDSKSEQEKLQKSKPMPAQSSKYGIYSSLFEVLAQSKPKCGKLTNFMADNEDIQKFNSDKTSFTKKLLEDLLPLTAEEKSQMKGSFQKVLNGFKALNMDVFGRNDKTPTSGKGIVMVGGHKFSWLSLLNIHQLRRRGSTLPVEVYIPTAKEYDDHFCMSVLPELDARCVLGYEELPFAQYEKFFNLQRYEYKIMAILTSNFEDVLLLDSDNVVLENPDGLFSWDVYKEYQLVLWPDCWQRTTNPFLFDMLNVTIDYSSVEDYSMYNLHNLPGAIPNPSTESGMMLVNKRSQVDTLLIALYFNIFGFDYYYPLITQGSAGQGDKDTYILAAYGAKNPVYQVKQGVTFIGRFEKDGGFTSGALGQCDPTTQDEKKAKIGSSGCSTYMFLHLSFPKFYPEEIADKLKGPDGHIVEFDGVDWGYDLELQIWEMMCQLLCSNYKKNVIQPENEASKLLAPKFRKTGQKLSYIKKLNINEECDTKLLPHLQFLRNYFKYADKSTNQFHQHWEGKDASY